MVPRGWQVRFLSLAILLARFSWAQALTGSFTQVADSDGTRSSVPASPCRFGCRSCSIVGVILSSHFRSLSARRGGLELTKLARARVWLHRPWLKRLFHRVPQDGLQPLRGDAPRIARVDLMIPRPRNFSPWAATNSCMRRIFSDSVA